MKSPRLTPSHASALAVAASVACAASVAGCKSRSFNSGSDSVRPSGAGRGETRPGPRPPPDPAAVAALARDLRAGLSVAWPPAADESGLERLPRLLDFGFTPPDISILLKHVTQDPPTPEAIEAGDLVDPDTPRGSRTITNEACFRDPASWRLTYVHFLPYERLVPGSYAAVAAWEKQARSRLLVPLTIRATFQPWCLSTRTPTKTQVFVLEQAFQVEWRLYDLGAERQRALAELVAKRTSELLGSGEESGRILADLASAFETTEAANARREALGELREVARAWMGGSAGGPTGGSAGGPDAAAALATVEGLAARGAREDFGWRDPRAKETPPLHPGFLVPGRFEEALRRYLKRFAARANLHEVRSTFAESQGKPVHARFGSESGKPRPETIATAQLVGPPWRLQPFGTMGSYASELDTGYVPRFQMDDARARKAFDEVDIAPSLLPALPRSETGAMRKRLSNPNRIHATTTHCTLCHSLGGGTILSGHTESEGIQISVSSLLRASEDATALARELSAD